MSDTVGVAGDRIRSFVERIEQLDTELQELNEGKKEVFAEAKGVAGELGALVAVEDLGPAMPSQGSSSASTQNAASRLIDTRQERTRRLNQSTTAAR